MSNRVNKFYPEPILLNITLAWLIKPQQNQRDIILTIPKKDITGGLRQVIFFISGIIYDAHIYTLDKLLMFDGKFGFIKIINLFLYP